MAKNICKDLNILSKQSLDATLLDSNVIDDLKDTLIANKMICVGMAANMIGVNKRIIAFYNNDKLEIMLNPKIIRHSAKFKYLSEGCLSLEGLREALRYDNITVEYLDRDFKKRIKTYTNFTAQIIQHELDHLDGIII